MTGNIDSYGDYQTPLSFAGKVIDIIKTKKYKFDYFLEPTCGVGAFIKATKNIFPDLPGLGIELNEKYVKELQSLNYSDVQILNADIFEYLANSSIPEKNNILIVGNPPWVTNSDMTRFEGSNLPVKKNFKNHRGLEAMTGEGNFDICEYILLRLLERFNNQNFYLSMLCKTSVALNVIKEMRRNNYTYHSIELYNFNAKEIFNVSTDATVLVIDNMNREEKKNDVVNVFNIEEPTNIINKMGYRNGKFYTRLLDDFINIDGNLQYEIRQGVKHDLSKVMEFKLDDKNKFINGFGEIVEIEEDLVYPLLKSSHIAKIDEDFNYERFVIVTQKKIGQDTQYIKELYPKTYNYLSKYRDKFSSRKSSIYKNAPEFAMFGVGDYTFSNYKLVISGFYKEPTFKYIDDDIIVVVDDTCYFIPFNDYKEGYITYVLMNSSIVKEFLLSIANIDSKRPFTKKILSRIDIQKVLKHIDYDEFTKLERNLTSSNRISLQDFRIYSNRFIEQMSF